MTIKCCQIGNSSFILLATLAVTQVFYFCTLEEYYTGGLFLPLGNGVTDGSVVFIALFMMCGIAGNDIFLYQIPINIGSEPFTMSAGYLLAYIIVITQVFAVLSNWYTIIAHQYKPLTPEQRAHGEEFHWFPFIQ
jgi:hypothetical protein